MKTLQELKEEYSALFDRIATESIEEYENIMHQMNINCDAQMRCLEE